MRESGYQHKLLSIKMASTPSSSEVDPEEDSRAMKFDAQKTGRAAEFPDFAIIWSFLENFRHLLHFPDLSLDDLEDGFNSHNSENGNVEMIEELFKKLLRRVGVSVNPEKWGKSLLKVAKEHGLVCAWDLEQFGYQELEVSFKLELFKLLLECQFDQNDKLKSSVNKGFDAEDLRMHPIGRDLDGFIYWYHEDDCNGVRLYTTEEDEVNCESWRLLVGESDELVAIVEFIESKSEVNPKEIALAKREEMKKKGEIKSPGKKKGKKGKKKEAVAEEDYDDDNPCARCFSNVRPDSILLCDKCDAAYHTACLRPPLLTVPQGDWFCPFCQQLALLEILKEKRTRIAARLKLRQKQAKRLGFAGIDLSNILQKTSDDEEDQGIRRSGRSRKNVDYTFKEFEEDITSAVENDKKRFKGDEVNGDEQELLYSKPAYETGRLLGTGSRNTRRSRRLMDLDYESDTESRTSEHAYEENSDAEQQQASTWHGNLRRQRRIINDDDDEEDDNDVVKNKNVEDPKVAEAGQDGERKDDQDGERKDDQDGERKDGQDGEVKDDQEEQDGDDKEKTGEQESEEKNENDGETAEKPDVQATKTDDDNKDASSETSTSSGNETEAVEAASVASSQPQNTILPGNKIHPHSRIASVAPVARNQPVADMNSYRTSASYPPEGVFPNPPNFDMLKPQFPAKQTPNYLGSNFGGGNIPAANLTGNNFPGVANPPNSGAPGILQGGPSFPGTQHVPNARTNFGGASLSGPSPGVPNFSGTNLNFPNANLGAQNVSGTNFGGSFPGVLSNFGTGAGANFGGASNFVGNNTIGLGGFGAVKSPTQTQNVSGSFWGGQNEFNSLYNYQGFPQSTGTIPATCTSPTNNQTLPPPYLSGAQFTGSSQYGGYSQQIPANSNMQNNYIATQQSGNFPDSSFFPATPQQPPPPYSATNSQNANFFTNTAQGQAGNFASKQWTYPEGYGFYPGQGSAAGQSF